MANLTEFKIGEQGYILGYKAGNKIYRQKLLAMGLTPGTPIVFKRVAPLGDPIQVEVRGYALTLRKSEAALLQIEKAI